MALAFVPRFGEDGSLQGFQLRCDHASQWVVDRMNDDDVVAPVWRKLQALKKSCSLAIFKTPRKIKMQTKCGPSFGCSFLHVVGFLSCLRFVGASPASAPGSSTSGMPSTFQIFSYMGVSATVIAMIIAFFACCLECYRRRGRRERGDDVRGALVVLTHVVGERPSGMYISVDSMEMREASLNGLIIDSRV